MGGGGVTPSSPDGGVPFPGWMGDQWRIQDFPDGGAPTSKVGAPTYYLAKFLPKTAWKWKNLDREGGARVPGAPPRSANGDYPIKSK